MIKLRFKFLFTSTLILFCFVKSVDASNSNLEKFQIQGVWVAFASENEAFNKACSSGTTIFKFERHRIYVLPVGGSLSILAEDHSYRIKQNKLIMNTSNSSLKAKVHAIIIDKDHFYIEKVYDFDKKSQKYLLTHDSNLFLKRCDS